MTREKNTTADDIVAITRAAEVVTVHKNQIVEVEVYFGWSIPHEAPAGGFIDEKKAEKMH
jgi:hypothetical protein